MLETVFSAELPVSERLLVRKLRIEGRDPSRARVAIVTGMHGDELEGQFVAFELSRRLKERLEDVCGTVDIYPALNPLGLSTQERGVPRFDIDLDRTFPGNPQGSLTEALAAAVLADIEGADVAVDVHAPSVAVREIEQVRIEGPAKGRSLELARLLNARIVWAQPPSEQTRSTLAHALVSRGTPTLVVEVGTGMRITEETDIWLVEGLLRLLEELGCWEGPTLTLPDPAVTDGSNVRSVLAETPGIFLPRAKLGRHVTAGTVLGQVCDPFEGVVTQEVLAPCAGSLFCLRTHPVIYPGSLVARILEGVR